MISEEREKTPTLKALAGVTDASVAFGCSGHAHAGVVKLTCFELKARFKDLAVPSGQPEPPEADQQDAIHADSPTIIVLTACGNSDTRTVEDPQHSKVGRMTIGGRTFSGGSITYLEGGINRPCAFVAEEDAAGLLFGPTSDQRHAEVRGLLSMRSSDNSATNILVAEKRSRRREAHFFEVQNHVSI